MIEIHGLGKRYGDHQVLCDVDLRADRGELLLLLGDNGAGKTTLLRAILGITSYAGRIRVDGLDPLRQGKAVRSRIGYLPQTAGLHGDLSARDTLRFYSALRGFPDVGLRADLEEVGLAGVAERRVAELSVGMRRRLGFAVANLGDPPVLLLDEPTASLDAGSRELLAQRLRALATEGRTILLSTHAQDYLAGTADRAVRLERGRLAA